MGVYGVSNIRYRVKVVRLLLRIEYAIKVFFLYSNSAKLIQPKEVSYERILSDDTGNIP